MAEEENGSEVLFVSLAVTYSTDSSDDGVSVSASMELNEDLNDGKTQFTPGDTAHIRMFTTPIEVEMEDWGSTAGNASGPGELTNLRIEEEKITFSDTDEANTSKPVLGGMSVRWMGTPAGGSIAVTPSGKLKLSKKGIGIAIVSYDTKYYPGSIIVNEITEDPFEAMVYTRARRKEA